MHHSYFDFLHHIAGGALSRSGFPKRAIVSNPGHLEFSGLLQSKMNTLQNRNVQIAARIADTCLTASQGPHEKDQASMPLIYLPTPGPRHGISNLPAGQPVRPDIRVDYGLFMGSFASSISLVRLISWGIKGNHRFHSPKG